jgi:hypothetical protein
MDRVHLHIDRLILDGISLDRLGQETLQSAIESELSRLLSNESLGGLENLGSVDRLRTDTISWTSNQSPEVLGEQIGQSVFGRITG